MKKFLQRVVLVAVVMATAQVAVAESWRINNDTSKGAHFVDINAAMASELVKDGDVLYLDPGCLITSEQTITKAVTIIGTGWSSTMLYPPATISGIFNVNVVGAKMMSLKFTNVVRIYSQNVVMERCYMRNVEGSADKATFIQCWLNYTTGSNSTTVVSGTNSSSYWKFYNCIIQHTQDLKSCYPFRYISNVELINNLIIGCRANITTLIAKNNIFLGGSYTLTPESLNAASLKYNCFSLDPSTYLENYPDNTFSDSKSLSHWTVQSGVDGAQFQLSENSPAKGVGEGGIDCGPFDGLYPFVLGGYPKHIPYFTEAAVPAQPTDGKVKVSLKIVNQND